MFKIEVLSIRLEMEKTSWILQIHATQHPIQVYFLEHCATFNKKKIAKQTVLCLKIVILNNFNLLNIN